MIDRQLGSAAEADVYRSIVAGDLAVEILTPTDWLRIAELVDTYADLRLGGVDASMVAVAERLGVGKLGTLDLRHFRVVRPRHVDAFVLSP